MKVRILAKIGAYNPNDVLDVSDAEGKALVAGGSADANKSAVDAALAENGGIVISVSAVEEAKPKGKK